MRTALNILVLQVRPREQHLVALNHPLGKGYLHPAVALKTKISSAYIRLRVNSFAVAVTF